MGWWFDFGLGSDQSLHSLHLYVRLRWLNNANCDCWRRVGPNLYSLLWFIKNSKEEETNVQQQHATLVHRRHRNLVTTNVCDNSPTVRFETTSDNNNDSNYTWRPKRPSPSPFVLIVVNLIGERGEKSTIVSIAIIVSWRLVCAVWHLPLISKNLRLARMRLTFLRISSAERVVKFNAQFLVWITLYSLYLSHRATICTLILIKRNSFLNKAKSVGIFI